MSRKNLIVFSIIFSFLVLMFGVFKFVQNPFSDYDSRYTETQLVSSDSLPKNYNIVFYRRDCPFCKAGKSAVLQTSKKSKLRTYYVNVKTAYGQAIVSKYKVSKAATIITIRGNQTKYYSYAYRTKDESFEANLKQIEEAFNE